jgi:hypothetical protein
VAEVLGVRAVLVVLEAEKDMQAVALVQELLHLFKVIMADQTMMLLAAEAEAQAAQEPEAVVMAKQELVVLV